MLMPLPPRPLLQLLLLLHSRVVCVRSLVHGVSMAIYTMAAGLRAGFLLVRDGWE